MIDALKLPGNLAIRPSRDEDRSFLENLYRSTREDLRLIDAESDFIEELVLMQYRAQVRGYSETYPDAFYFVVEQMGDRIGRVTIDFGHNEVHILDIAFIPEARGKGLGASVIKALQHAAAQVMAPLTLSVHRGNPGAKRFYLTHGFRVEQSEAMVERMVWHPRPA